MKSPIRRQRRRNDVRRVLAVDLGASTGRGLVGAYDGALLTTSEIHRFRSQVHETSQGLEWRFDRVLDGVRTAVAKACDEGDLSSVGIDGWGVDYGLVDLAGDVIGVPRSYRDRDLTHGVARVHRRVTREELYATTGTQFLPFNTIYQLAARRDDLHHSAPHKVVLIPDLVAFLLTGVAVAEETNASTTSLVNVETNDWSERLLDVIGVSREMFPDIVAPGTELGVIKDASRGRTTVRAVASHDTASAVVGTPIAGPECAFISSGTWSIVGVEVDGPILSSEAQRLNFGNERGFGGRTRFVRNVMGLWIAQECARAWRLAPASRAFESLLREAAAQSEPVPLIDPDDESFFPPGDPSQRIAALCLRTGQVPPSTRGALLRSILDSLACKYRLRLEQLEIILGRSISAVHVVGGGALNGLLCQVTANVTGRPVFAGPTEAAAIGNILVQLHALGEVSGLEEMRALVRTSLSPRLYEPRGARDELFERFLSIGADGRPSEADTLSLGVSPS